MELNLLECSCRNREMDHNPSSSSSKVDRKTIEKNRRNLMKALCSSLSSLVPHQAPREALSLQDQLEGATNYIKNLQSNVEKMKRKRNCLMGVSSGSSSSAIGGTNLPSIDVRVTGSAMEVVLITGLNCHQFMFTETMRLLHEEGADVVSASFSVLDNTVFHTMHCKINGESSAQGSCVAARISERLRKLVYEIN